MAPWLPKKNWRLQGPTTSNGFLVFAATSNHPLTLLKTKHIPTQPGMFFRRWFGPSKPPFGGIWTFPKIVVPSNHPILIGFSILNHPFWGTRIFGNTHMDSFPGGYTSLQPWDVQQRPFSFFTASRRSDARGQEPHCENRPCDVHASKRQKKQRCFRLVWCFQKSLMKRSI